MNMFVKLIPAIIASIALPSFAGERVEQSLPASGVNSVSIENLRGEVKVIGWDQQEVSLSGELDDKAERLIFEQNGSQIMIKVVIPRHSHHGHNNNRNGSKLTIKMPKDVRMNFEGVSSDIDLSNLMVGAEVKTVSGDIEAVNLSEHIELGTVSGNIESKDLDGKIRLSSVSGDIKDRNSNGRVQLKAVSGEIVSNTKAREVFVNNVSGNIDLSMADIDELVASTVSGDVDANLTLKDSGLVKLSSVSGDMEIDFQSGVEASFRMNASAGGDLENKLTSDRAKRAKYGPSSKLNFQTGSGSASVRASTVSGEILVK